MSARCCRAIGRARVEQEAHDALAARDLLADEVAEAPAPRAAPSRPRPSRRARRAPPRSRRCRPAGSRPRGPRPATSWPRKARRSEAMRRISSARCSVMSSNAREHVGDLRARAAPAGGARGRGRPWALRRSPRAACRCGRPARRMGAVARKPAGGSTRLQRLPRTLLPGLAERPLLAQRGSRRRPCSSRSTT